MPTFSRHRIWVIAVLVMLVFMGAAPAHAELRMPLALTSNMVLQRDMPVRIWGWAQPNDQITVDFAGQRAMAMASADGDWKVMLDPMPASAEERSMTISAANQAATIELTGILVGEVWVCSGQSNMGGAMDSYKANDPDAFATSLPTMRYFVVPYRGDYHPQRDVSQMTNGNRLQWQVCDTEHIRFVSATAFYFGREIQRRFNVPVGLVVSALGGTPIEAWAPRAAFDQDDETRAVLNDWETRLVATYPDGKNQFRKRQLEWLKLTEEYAAPTSPYGQWWAKVVAARQAGQTPPPMPADLPPDPNNGPVPVNFRAPTTLYNGMIAPLTAMTIRGVIWYQGEGNSTTGNLDVFGRMTAATIREWRRDWGLGDFAFLMVQLPYLTAVNKDPNDPADWQRTRDQQRRAAAAVPNSIAVVTFDTGHETDTHPANKDLVGYRLGLAARALAYGEKILYRGPEPASVTRKGKAVQVTFDHVGQGLAVKQDDGKLSAGGAVKGFAVAGADGKFVFANATIAGKTVDVQCDAVPDPVTVRYGWANHPVVNLFNRDGLPAGPFEAKVSTP